MFETYRSYLRIVDLQVLHKQLIKTRFDLGGIFPLHLRRTSLTAVRITLNVSAMTYAVLVDMHDFLLFTKTAITLQIKMFCFLCLPVLLTHLNLS